MSGLQIADIDINNHDYLRNLIMNDINQQSDMPDEVQFHFLKTGNYRTFHVDGAFGGPTPSGGIYLELYVEHASTPKTITNKLNPDGTISHELDRQGKSGMVREIEAGLVMDIKTAEELNQWLSEQIALLKTNQNFQENNK